jgi:hypothetical protein
VIRTKNKMNLTYQHALLLTNGIGHGWHLHPPELCKRNLNMYTPTVNRHLAATPHTVDRYMQALTKTLHD